MLKSRLAYLNRVIKAYLTNTDSHLTFWHGTPAIHPEIDLDSLGPYYMRFAEKAMYSADLDENGIPMLDYHGQIGLQYNPIAIAQYGLGNYNRYLDLQDDESLSKFILVSDWLVENLETNDFGIHVWNHHFDWEYRDTLKAPWISALSQGQGISCLLRAHDQTRDEKYLTAAEQALGSFLSDMDHGGVVYTDNAGYLWLEESIVHPPTHILNGFFWAIWGIYDYYLYQKDPRAKDVYDRSLETLIHYLPSFDTGYWSLYEHAGERMLMLASPFYHRLHIVQLKIMSMITGQAIFREYAEKWERYQKNALKRYFSLAYKMVFKIFYY